MFRSTTILHVLDDRQSREAAPVLAHEGHAPGVGQSEVVEEQAYGRHVQLVRVVVGVGVLGGDTNMTSAKFWDFLTPPLLSFITGRGVRSATGSSWLRFGMFHHPDGQ